MTGSNHCCWSIVSRTAFCLFCLCVCTAHVCVCACLHMCVHVCSVHAHVCMFMGSCKCGSPGFMSGIIFNHSSILFNWDGRISQWSPEHTGMGVSLARVLWRISYLPWYYRQLSTLLQAHIYGFLGSKFWSLCLPGQDFNRSISIAPRKRSLSQSSDVTFSSLLCSYSWQNFTNKNLIMLNTF